MDDKSKPGGRKRPPFNWIRRDLDRALAMAGLEAWEAKLMVIARELCYGRAQQIGKDADPVPFRFNAKAIARDWGGSPNKLRAARQRLIDDRLLLETPGGLIINKAYEEWKGAHALTPRQVETAREARRHGAIQKYGEGGPRADPLEAAEGGPSADPLTTVKGVRGRTPRASVQWSAGGPPRGSAGGPPPSSLDVLGDLETLNTTTTTRTCAGGGSPNSPSEPAERKDVLELVRRLNFNFETWARDACQVWPAVWVRAVAEKYLPGCKKSPLEYSKYLNSILRRWATQGHPDPANGAPGHRAPAGDPAPTNVLRVERRKEVDR